MFTGLVEGMAEVFSADAEGGGLCLWLDFGALREGLEHGDSISVAGACLTAVGFEGPRVRFDLSQETLVKTALDSVAVGDRLNIERSLKVGDRLGGHFVSGHVDGLGRVIAIEQQGEYAVHTYRAPESVVPLLVPKGSVTIEGVSLTVAELRDEGEFTVALIPETLQVTTLGQERPGDVVRMEGDMLGKYVMRYLALGERDPERLRAALAQLVT